MRGHIRARDPVTGKVKFEIPYAGATPHASLLSTGGNVLFVPEADGTLVAYDATNGKKLWTHNNGQGHNGGIITYMAKGKQYVAVDDRLGHPGRRRLRRLVGRAVEEHAEGLRRAEGVRAAVVERTGYSCG